MNKFYILKVFTELILPHDISGPPRWLFSQSDNEITKYSILH